MRRELCLCFLLICSPLYAADENKGFDETPTHTQTNLIKIAQSGSDTMKVNAFCLGQDGRILAACGLGPGEIRVLNDKGKLLKSWTLSVKPEAINTAGNGSILVGGDGKLFRFDSNGKLLKQSESPHAETLRSKQGELRKEAISYIERSSGNNPAAQIEVYEQIVKDLETKAAKEGLNDQEKQTLELIPRVLEPLRKQLAKQTKKKKGPTESQIKKQMDTLLKSKMRIASISTDEKNIFVATRALTGYRYAIWKLNKDFSGGEEIVTGLSGCCGQMDVQACKNGLYVAENSRHRVVRYDTSGKVITTWGKQARTGIRGFSSCCNPMNVCFNNVGDVFTAESSTGRIKRYSPDGKLLSYVGEVKLVPGCKNVSIAVAKNDTAIYMLDLTRNHIVVMKKNTNDSITKADSTAGGDE